EGVLDYSWCERYQLGDDGRTWALKPGQAPADHHIDDAGVSAEPVSGELVDANTTGDAAQGETVETFGSDKYQDDSSALFNVVELPFRAQLLAQYMAEERHVYHISMPHRQELSVLEMDTDNAAVQDLILAAENIPEIKKYDMPALWKFT
ncbi:exodeoxyribonuclease, partial [Escherichia coli]|uniref:RecE family exodeoxyribonuclease n=1 Tax=Escherichia coli TaxID=562 RepID=UPI0032C16FAF|nr:exodeoxyribonuclease [Escherichia coli]